MNSVAGYAHLRTSSMCGKTIEEVLSNIKNEYDKWVKNNLDKNVTYIDFEKEHDYGDTVNIVLEITYTRPKTQEEINKEQLLKEAERDREIALLNALKAKYE